MYLSNASTESVYNSFHSATFLSNSSPFGANLLPLTYSKVVSSGAIIPDFPPPSIAMLQIVILPSIDIFLIVSPKNSNAYPFPSPIP